MLFRSALGRHADGSVRQAMVMARYGGMDIVAALAAFSADKKFSAVAAQALATAVSDREGEQRYLMLTDWIEGRLVDAARNNALSGEAGEAMQISTLYQNVQQQRTIAEAYKLDRKLEVFNLLRRVHPYLGQL